MFKIVLMYPRGFNFKTVYKLFYKLVHVSMQILIYYMNVQYKRDMMFIFPYCIKYVWIQALCDCQI